MSLKYTLVICFVVNFIGSSTFVRCSTNLDLHYVCSPRTRTRLSHVDQLENLIDQFGKVDWDSPSWLKSECNPKIGPYLNDLLNLINKHSNDVCSMQSAQAVRKFYLDHVATHDEGTEDDKNRTKIPKVFRDFFLAYGLKVSKLCKKMMIASLEYETNRRLKETDFIPLNPWIDDGGMMGQLMGDVNNYDDLILPSEIMRVYKEDRAASGVAAAEDENESSSENIVIQTATGPLIRHIKALCVNRFKPIYDTYLIPILILANIGFNYQGDDLQREMAEMHKSQLVSRWYRIVYLCDSLLHIVIKATDETNGDNLAERQIVKVINVDEGSSESAREVDKIEGIERLVIDEDNQSPMGREILDLEEDKKLIKLIDNFNINRSESARTRSKLFWKLAKLATRYMREGKLSIKSALVDFIRSGKHSSSSENSAANANEEMIRLIDSYLAGDDNASVADLRDLKDNAKNWRRTTALTTKRMYFQYRTDGVQGLVRRAQAPSSEIKRRPIPVLNLLSGSLFVLGVILVLIVCFHG